MKPLLIIDESTVDALERKAHAGLASAVLGAGAPLRHFMRIPGRHLRFEVYAPRAAEPRIRRFLQKQVALGPASSAVRAEYKFQAVDGQHVLKVFDRREATSGDAGFGLLGRWVGRLYSGTSARASGDAERLRQHVEVELSRAVDRLTGPAAQETGGHIRIELLHDVAAWLPVASHMAPMLAARAAERLRIFHGRAGDVRVSVTQPEGTQPLGVDGELLRAMWADEPVASVPRTADAGEPGRGAAPHPSAGDPEGTLMIESPTGGQPAHQVYQLRVSGPTGTVTVPLPPKGRVVLSRAWLGKAIAAVGADVRLLPRDEQRCPALDLGQGGARLVAGGEHPRFATIGGQPLGLGLVTVPTAMHLGRRGRGQDESDGGGAPVTVRLERA
jgi:hypothetical protein